jgi:hypothetical protein
MADHGHTTARLRKEIDSGRAGSKVDYPDPAAAPLGTDDEAAGTPPSAAAVSLARQHEVENAPVETHTGGLDSAAYLYAGILVAVAVALSAIAVWLLS